MKLGYRLLLIIALVLPSLTGAQTPNDFAVEISLLSESELDALYLADIDLQNFDTSEDIFAITIRKNNPDEGEVKNCFLHIELTRDNAVIVSAISEPFAIPASFTEKTFTNRELAVGFDFGNGQIAYFHQVRLTSGANALRNDILKSGKLPVGVYKIAVELRLQDAQETLIGRNEKILIRATNPSYLQLITPGVPTGNGLTANIYSPYPVFQWTGNGSEYQVFVFEKKEMMQTYDDIINSRPNWESERLSKLSVQYPQASDAVPLEFGKTYYWMVRMYSETSAGEEKQDSEIWEFSLVDPQESTNLQDQIVRDDIFRFLAELLGSRANEIRASLEGYRLKRIRFNGEEITLNQLYELINQYQGQSFEIIDFIPPSPER